jgi:hypothetical protein
MTVTAHNQAQAEYLIRSRAEQRGVALSSIDVTDGGHDTWLVTVTVADDAAEVAGHLGDDTQVLHFDFHRSRRNQARP